MGRRAEQAARNRKTENGTGLQSERLRYRQPREPIADERDFATPAGPHRLDIRPGATHTDLPLWLPNPGRPLGAGRVPLDWHLKVIPRERYWGAWSLHGGDKGVVDIAFYSDGDFEVTPDRAPWRHYDEGPLLEWVEGFGDNLYWKVAVKVWDRFDVARELVLGWTEPGTSDLVSDGDLLAAQARQEGFPWPDSIDGTLLTVRYPHRPLIPIPEWSKGELSFTTADCIEGDNHCLMEFVLHEGDAVRPSAVLAHVLTTAKGWSVVKTDAAMRGSGTRIAALRHNLMILNDDVLHDYARHQANLLMGTTSEQQVVEEIARSWEVEQEWRGEREAAYARRAASRLKTLEERRQAAAGTDAEKRKGEDAEASSPDSEGDEPAN